MRIEFRRTFSQFVDNYIATYFGTSGKAFTRIIGGPLLIVCGAFLIIYTRNAELWSAIEFMVNIAAVVLILYGTYFTLRPALNIFLVWLRRDQFLGLDSVITLELRNDKLRVHEGTDAFDLPLDQIVAVQRRATSAWIITKSDNLIYFPIEDLLSGDADTFLDALDEAIAPEEKE